MTPNYNLFYVEDTDRSRDFYAAILDRQPVDHSETFSVFVLPSGLKLGLWKKGGVEPAANQPGGFELGFQVDNMAEVDRLAADWTARGITLIQPLVDMDFGRTFTAIDPDGHRLRVLCLAA